MKRHFLLALAAMSTVLAGLSLTAAPARAQVITTPGAGAVAGTGFLADPFSFYYAIYLPNQQLQAMRPTPIDSVNDAMVTRQYFAQSSRRGLYDPISPYAETYDPLRPYSNQQERIARPYRFARGTQPSSPGMGPPLYFNRIAQYYPDMANRKGQQRNANTGRGTPRTGRGGGMGGMGMGGMGMGGGMGGMGMGGMGMF